MLFISCCLSTETGTVAVGWNRSMLAKRKHSAPTDAPTRSGLIRSSVRSFRPRRKRLPCNAKAAPGEVPRRTRAIPQALRAQIVHRGGEVPPEPMMIKVWSWFGLSTSGVSFVGYGLSWAQSWMGGGKAPRPWRSPCRWLRPVRGRASPWPWCPRSLRRRV